MTGRLHPWQATRDVYWTCKADLCRYILCLAVDCVEWPSASYIFGNIQNQLIKAIFEVMKQTVVEELKNNKYFTDDK